MAAPNQHLAQTSDFPLSGTTFLPIAELDPLISPLSSRSITAVVTLIWPYSDSKRSISLLLAESDFRLRRTRGQVRIYFYGSAAKAVARSGVGSGDTVMLCLEGSEWIKGESVMSTPGRGIDWDLRFIERLRMVVNPQSEQSVVLDVDRPTPSPTPEAQQRSPSGSPPPQVQIQPVPSLLPKTPANEWSSPAFLKRSRLSSGSFLDSAYDPFADTEGYLENKGRKRTKFGRESSGWRYVERSPSPEKEANGASLSKYTNGLVNSNEEVVMNTNGVASIEGIAETKSPGKLDVRAHESTERVESVEITETEIRIVDVEMEDAGHANITTTYGHETDIRTANEKYHLDRTQVAIDALDVGPDSVDPAERPSWSDDAALPLTSEANNTSVVHSRLSLVLQTDSRTNEGDTMSSSLLEESQGIPTSPVLRPIPSPSLPRPSPFTSVLQERIDYFHPLEAHEQASSGESGPRIEPTPWVGENSYLFVEHPSSDPALQAEEAPQHEGEEMDVDGPEVTHLQESSHSQRESESVMFKPVGEGSEQIGREDEEDGWDSGEDDDKENLYPPVYRQPISPLDSGQTQRPLKSHLQEAELDEVEDEELPSSPPSRSLVESSEIDMDEEEDDHQRDDEDQQENGEAGFEEFLSESESEVESAFGSESGELGQLHDIYPSDHIGERREDIVDESKSEVDESDLEQQAEEEEEEEELSEGYDSENGNPAPPQLRQPEVIDLISDDEEDNDASGDDNVEASATVNKEQSDDRRQSFGWDGMDEFSVKSVSDVEDHVGQWNIISPSRKYLKTTQTSLPEVINNGEQTLVVEEEVRVVRQREERNQEDSSSAIRPDAGLGATSEGKETDGDEHMGGIYEEKDAGEREMYLDAVETGQQADVRMEIGGTDGPEQGRNIPGIADAGNKQLTTESEGDTFMTVPEPSDNPELGESQVVVMGPVGDVFEATALTESGQGALPTLVTSDHGLGEEPALEHGYPNLPESSSNLTGIEFANSQLSFVTAVSQRKPEEVKDEQSRTHTGEISYPTLPTIRECGEQTPPGSFDEAYQPAPKSLPVGYGSHQLMTPEATQQTYVSVDRDPLGDVDSFQDGPASQLSPLQSQEVDSRAQLASQDTAASPELSTSLMAERQPLTGLSPGREVESNGISLQVPESHSHQIHPTPLTPALTARTSSGLQEVSTPHPTPQTSLISKLREIKYASTKKVTEIISPWFTSSQPAPSQEPSDSITLAPGAGGPSPTLEDPPVIPEKELSPDPLGLTTSHSFFPHLSAISTLFNSQIDVLAVVPAAPSAIARAGRKPKHYHLTLSITDPTLPATGPESTVSASLHRPFKKAVPVVQEGDVVLLRGFKVVSVKGRLGLKSGDASAWAVWSDETSSEPDIRGPPVEFGEAELKEVGRLREWWKEQQAMSGEQRMEEQEERGEFTMGVGEELKEGGGDLDADAVEMDVMMSEQNGGDTPIVVG